MTKKNFLIPEESEDLKEWYNSLGVHFLKKISVKKGFYILDFGCRTGTYTFPAAKLVGPKGRVFALDCEQEAIDEIRRKSILLDLTNIVVPIKTDGELIIPLEDGSADLTLLYDVIGIIVRNKDGIKVLNQLIKEIQRITKNKGELSVIFKHIDRWEFSKEQVMSTIQQFFTLIRKESIQHIHWNFFEIDIVYTFKKE